MIKNIIFDLGNVLIDFKPREYLLSQGRSTDEADFLYREIFQSREWVELDRGTIKSREAIQAIVKRNPDEKELIESHSDFRPLLTPIESNTGQLEDLKDRGYRLFYLTNYHDELFDYTYEAYDFFQLFEGGVVSAHVKKIKPEREIYEILLDKYDLDPGETLFIDDSEKNTRAASELGIHTIHLPEPRMLESELEKKLTVR